MSSGSTSPATPRPATRSSAVNSGSMKAMPSTRSSSSAARTASRASVIFQENLEIKQTEGSAPDRVVLAVNVEEKPTGQLPLSGGYSSLERFVIQLGLSQNNFMGKGQSLDAVGQLFALFEVDPASASPIPISWTSRSCSAARFSAATTTASIIIGNEREHDLFAGQHRRRPSHRLPADRILERRRAATSWSTTRSRSMRAPSSPNGDVMRPAQGRPLSVR